jgi:YVTN family beta-propeller protein
VGAALALLAGASGTGASSFVTFESGPVRPLALAPSGDRLFVTNTPDNRLEIFDVDAGGLTHVDSVPVGLEPVAVAARTDGEVWVVDAGSDPADPGSTP